MNRFSTLFTGILVLFATSWLGLIVVPYFQIGRLKADVNEETKAANPPLAPGEALAGHKVYAANGCMYCHTQQLRPFDMLESRSRDWGTRRTVARDYLFEQPPLLGLQRTGPDLTNVGKRQPTEEWHYKHLYYPRSVTPGSIMPSYRFLFEERKITGQVSAHALKLDGKLAPKPGYEIVPTQDGRDLVAYLISLNRAYGLPEAPEK